MYLVECTLASVVRMFNAYIVSLLLALFLGTAMARNKRVERVMMPILDILQSIPILGFFPAALAIFIHTLPPGLGVEAAAVFLITTSLVWNMIFGVYSSVKSVEPGVFEMAKIYRFGRAATFFYIYAPASKVALIANSLISWAGGWFFLTASEVISMGAVEYRLVGLGTFTIEAFERGDQGGFWAGVVAMLLVILASYLVLWNPAARESIGVPLPSLRTTYARVHGLFTLLWRALSSLFVGLDQRLRPKPLVGRALLLALALLVAYSLLKSPPQLSGVNLSLLAPVATAAHVLTVATQLPLTLARVGLIVSASSALSLLIAYLSFTRPKSFTIFILAGEALASIPAILWWPILAGIARAPLGPPVICTIVYLQGALWYTYFNLAIYGLGTVRARIDLVNMARIYRVRGPLFVRKVFLPMVLPSFATGALSAWGGAWNASIAAEYASFEDFVVNLGGTGSLLSQLTGAGDIVGVLLVALAMSLTIVVVNKTVWARFFKYVERMYGGGE